jgi:hypothetical protein
MTNWPFNSKDLSTINAALEIAEESTGDFYKFSFAQWKRHHYDVKTLSSLNDEEITLNAFALLNKGSRITSGFDSRTKERDFYFICLQDHHILKALGRDRNLGVTPLLVYIFTHELVHIVRFCNFNQRFDLSGKNRDTEEKIVHATTYEILKDISLPKLDYVLEAYQDKRVCHLAVA